MATEREILDAFNEEGGRHERYAGDVLLPRIPGEPPRRTAAGTAYLTGPGVAMMGRMYFRPEQAREFLAGFGEETGFLDYLDDPTRLDHGEGLCKFAGQLCYLSLGPGRTKNADAGRYFTNIKEQAHGSVLEHTVYSMLWWGVSRSVTHEAVRHRAGTAFSQVSQRYVGGDMLRFVERPEYQGDAECHANFERFINTAHERYERSCDRLLTMQRGGGAQVLTAEARTEARKKVRQAARESLPNCTEAPIQVTMNGRAWRHFIEMRASSAAEIEIRRVAWRTLLCLASVDPHLWNDIALTTLPDGTRAATAGYRKV